MRPTPKSPGLARRYGSRLWSPDKPSVKRKRSKATKARTPPRTPTRVYSDRFIPSRSSSLLETGFEMLDDAEMTTGSEEPSTHRLLLRTEMLGPGTLAGELNSSVGAGSGAASAKAAELRSPATSQPASPRRNLFRFQSNVEPRKRDVTRQFSLSPLGPDSERLLASPRRAPRKIPSVPYKVLDAPALQDDYYLNLVDWSALNVLAVGLAQSVYLWSASTSKVTRLVELPEDDCITSVSWSQKGTHLSVGTHSGDVLLYEASTATLVRTMKGHEQRVGAMSWSSFMLATGGRDNRVFLRDVRAKESCVAEFRGHKQEVCGLKWSPDGQHLASGGNDNKLLIWNAATQTLQHKFSAHQAAVKAIAWSPHQSGLVASGGGTADRCIRFWNTTSGKLLRTVDTGSQVCNLAWSRSVDEIVSSHGYSLNQVVVWKYPTMDKIATLSGHTHRVLYMAMSPDGRAVVTGAGDETLRFWNVFPPSRSRRLGQSPAGALSMGSISIR